MYKEYTCICKRDFDDFKLGDRYVYRILYQDLYAIFYHDFSEGSFKMSDTQFLNYFMTLEEYRDQKIDEIWN